MKQHVHTRACNKTASVRVAYPNGQRATIKIAGFCRDTPQTIREHMAKHWPNACVLSVRLK